MSGAGSNGKRSPDGRIKRVHAPYAQMLPKVIARFAKNPRVRLPDCTRKPLKNIDPNKKTRIHKCRIAFGLIGTEENCRKKSNEHNAMTINVKAVRCITMDAWINGLAHQRDQIATSE